MSLRLILHSFEQSAKFGAASRIVVLRGTLTVSQLFSPNLFNVDQWLLNGLRNQGFTVNAVRMSAAGWVGYSNNVEIETVLNNEFSAEQQRTAIQNGISNITANYGLNRVFSNVALNIAYDGNVNTGGYTSTYDTSNQTNTSILSGLFGDDPTGVKQIAGVSITTAILLGVGLVAILALKGSNPIAVVRSYRGN